MKSYKMGVGVKHTPELVGALIAITIGLVIGLWLGIKLIESGIMR